MTWRLFHPTLQDAVQDDEAKTKLAKLNLNKYRLAESKIYLLISR
jgi:hypothetical protein